ncbi:MAG: hypothetical protein R3A46_09180 [Thermomicrobiales bacterium]
MMPKNSEYSVASRPVSASLTSKTSRIVGRATLIIVVFRTLMNTAAASRGTSQRLVAGASEV